MWSQLPLHNYKGTCFYPGAEHSSYSLLFEPWFGILVLTAYFLKLQVDCTSYSTHVL